MSHPVLAAPRRPSTSWRRSALVALALVTTAARAAAEPTPIPLEDLIADAERHAVSVQRSARDLDLALATADTVDGGLWPRLEARVGYTRNQHDAVVTLPDGDGTRSITITPFDQVEASATLTIPLLDLARRARVDATETRVERGRENLAEARLRIAERVATSYFRLAFAQASQLIAESQLALETARLAEAEVRREAGLTNPLALANALAEVERARLRVANARLDRATAQLELAEWTARPPESLAAVYPSGDPEVPSRANLLAMVQHLPNVRAAQIELTARRRDADAAGLDLVPTVDAFVSDRLSNAAGFGEANNISAGLTARFQLDVSTLRRKDELNASARAAELEVEALRREATTRISRLHLEVEARRAAVASARAELAARDQAERELVAREGGGLATSLERRTAERDRLAAELQYAQAEAELHLSRTLLLIAAGVELGGPRLGPPPGATP